MVRNSIKTLSFIIAAAALSACSTTGDEKLEKQVATAHEQEVKQEAAEKDVSDKPYGDIIAKYAAQNEVPLDLAHAVVYTESTYRANARGAVGEIGLMQLRLPTARMMGYKGSAKALYNPDTNIRYGMKYLGKAHKLAGGKTCGTILRYNAGLGAKRMNPISANYCKKVAKILR